MDGPVALALTPWLVGCSSILDRPGEDSLIEAVKAAVC